MRECYVRMTGLVAKMPSSVLMGIGIWVGTVGVDSSPKEIDDAGRTETQRRHQIAITPLAVSLDNSGKNTRKVEEAGSAK